MDGGRGLKAAESVRMTLLDHIILADEQYYSFKDNKKLYFHKFPSKLKLFSGIICRFHHFFVTLQHERDKKGGE